MTNVVETLKQQRFLQVMKERKRKESISGYRIIDVNMLSSIFGEISHKK